MAEVIGTISAVNQLLESAVQLIGRLRQAYMRFKELTELFEKLEQHVSSIRKIIEMVKEQTALQTDNVDETLVRLKATESNLVKWLKKVDSGKKGSIHQFAHQLIHGSKEREALAEIMNELNRVKADLCVSIQIVLVGITRTVGNKVDTSNEVVNQINRRLRRIIGQKRELEIVELVKAHDEPVHLSDTAAGSLASEDECSTDGSELATFTAATSPVSPGTTKHTTKASRVSTAKSPPATSPWSSPTLAANSSSTRERIVRNNIAKKNAIMVNAPIEDDLWWKMDRIVIEGNEAEDSTMINYMNSMDNLDNVVDLEERRKRNNVIRV